MDGVCGLQIYLECSHWIVVVTSRNVSARGGIHVRRRSRQGFRVLYRGAVLLAMTLQHLRDTLIRWV